MLFSLAKIDSLHLIAILIGSLLVDLIHAPKVSSNIERIFVRRNRNLLIRLSDPNRRIRNRVTSGERITSADRLNYGYLAQVFIPNDTQIIKCSGTILNAQHILTAAHCIPNATNHKFPWINVGSVYDMLASNHNQNVATFIGIKVIIHPQHDSFNHQQDIAIIRLNHPIKFNKQVYPVMLPIAGDIPDVDRCKVIGWKIDDDHDNLESLHVLPIRIRRPYDLLPINFSDKSVYNRSNELYSKFLVSEDSTITRGDSGGPLMCPVMVQAPRWNPFPTSTVQIWKQFGITSKIIWPINMEERFYRVNFSRIRYFLDWIRQTIIAKGTEDNSTVEESNSSIEPPLYNNTER